MYEKFVELLERTGRTTYQVAKATGISTAAFTAWKQGKYNFKQDKLQKIADYFGISIDYFSEVPNSGHHPEYYINRETAEIAQELFDNPNLRILFDAARDSRPEDLIMAAALLKRFKETNKE